MTALSPFRIFLLGNNNKFNYSYKFIIADRLYKFPKMPQGVLPYVKYPWHFSHFPTLL